MTRSIIFDGYLTVGATWMELPIMGDKKIKLIIAPDSTNAGDIRIGTSQERLIATAFKLEGALSEEIDPSTPLFAIASAANQHLNVMIIQL